jgi:PHS family inorganic phosphate transporter-like MFS transporter
MASSDHHLVYCRFKLSTSRKLQCLHADYCKGLDLPFYGLGMNSPHIISTIWYGKTAPPANIYPLLVHDVWQSLVVVSLGACIGCAITFVAIDKLGRRNIQIIGFFWLFILFIVIGGSFNHLYETGGNAAILVLYILCQIFFNFGLSNSPIQIIGIHRAQL